MLGNRRFPGVVVALLLVQHLALVAYVGWAKSPVFDEFPHLAAGLSHIEYGEFSLYRVNPPLVRTIAAIPVALVEHEIDWEEGWARDPKSRPEFMLGQRFARANGERSFWLFTLARWACLPFMLLGGWVCYQWAKELYGTPSGVTAVALWCFCPNLIGWGATICPDAPAAAMGLLAGYSFHRCLRQPSLSRASIAGLTLGLALLTKTTWIILPPLWVLLWVCRRQQIDSTAPVSPTDPRPTPSPDPLPITAPKQHRAQRGWRYLLFVLGLGWYTLCAGYGFQGTFRSLQDYTFVSKSLNGEAEAGDLGNRFRGTLLGELPIPLPDNYVMGIDIQRSEFEKGKWSYLRGEQRFGGWWYWYLYALGVKTPIGTLVLLLVAAATWRWLPNRSGNWREELTVLVPALALLLLVSSQTGFNRYLRYALPAVPFLYVFASRFAQVLGSEGLVIHQRTFVSPRWGAILLTACAGGAALSSLAIYPHSMSYFHELAGGPEQGHQHLLDANIDWGQDLLELRRWMAANRVGSELHLAYFGWNDPRALMLDLRPVPKVVTDEAGHLVSGDPTDIIPGWYAVSVNLRFAYRHYGPEKPNYTWLAPYPPTAKAGYSIWIYHLDEAQVTEIRARLR